MLGSIDRLPVAPHLLCFDKLLARQLTRHDVAAVDGGVAIAGVGHRASGSIGALMLWRPSAGVGPFVLTGVSFSALLALALRNEA
jgi:hypothetical protein